MASIFKNASLVLLAAGFAASTSHAVLSWPNCKDIANTDFGEYTAEQYFDDLGRITQYQSDPELADVPSMLEQARTEPDTHRLWHFERSTQRVGSGVIVGEHVYIQNENPGPEKVSNWLPAPKGKFQVMLRMYWPRDKPPSILDGSWKVPPITGGQVSQLDYSRPGSLSQADAPR